ncbi:DNA-processing protein DprA [uncultured Mesonia sp.]|uniref:DNA-processing protein DprA n=1 Tax=uncultured Mesonia sp. TaxID=399731 RepID=UPI00374F9665
MTENELLYTLALQRVNGIGDILAKKLLKIFGKPEAIFKASRKDFESLDGFGDFRVEAILEGETLSRAEEELQFIRKNNIKPIYFEDDDYPSLLKHCVDSPILLFTQGDFNINNKRMLSIVGTRQVTNHGIAFCESLLEALKPLNPVIVSGFAYGVDIAAHKAAVKNNLQTIACLAHGLDTIYPKTHSCYMPDILKHGGFFTDFWSNANFDRKNFIRRNRIIAGLSEATIVIESAEKGGSLITAEIANSYNREVFAVPGRTTDSMSIGCNKLIKTHQARLLTGVEDLIYQLNWDVKEKPIQTQLFVDLEGEEKLVYETLKSMGKAEVDNLALNCELPTFKLNPILLNLELKGVLRPLPGKLFEVI